MKFTVIGASEFTLAYTNALLEKGAEISAVISIPKHALPLNPADIKGYAKSRRLHYREFEDINSREAVKFIKNQNSDYIFSSWPKMIGKEILNASRGYCIGTHPTDLPHNRGRHPLHWLIALGIPESKLSFFAMNEGVDDGNVLLQVPYKILPTDSIKDLISRVNECAYEGAKILYNKLENSFEGKKQNSEIANYWRKRNPHDSVIDLRMPAELISRLIRSYAPPFNCASLVFEDKILPITNSRKISMVFSEEELKRIEPGKIIGIYGKKIIVKSDDSILELECCSEIPVELKKKKYIQPPAKYFSKFQDLDEKLT